MFWAFRFNVRRGPCCGCLKQAGPQGVSIRFQKKGTDYVEPFKLTAEDGAAYDYFGDAVSTSQKKIYVGDPSANNKQGAVYKYDLSGIQQLKLEGDEEGGLFGYSLASSGTTLVVGAPWEDSSVGANDYAGTVYVFKGSPDNETKIPSPQTPTHMGNLGGP